MQYMYSTNAIVLWIQRVWLVRLKYSLLPTDAQLKMHIELQQSRPLQRKGRPTGVRVPQTNEEVRNHNKKVRTMSTEFKAAQKCKTHSATIQELIGLP